MAYSKDLKTHISKDNLLIANTFDVPLSYRMSNIWKELSWGLLFIPAYILILILMVPGASTTSVMVMGGFGVGVCALLMFAAYWFGYKSLEISYKVLGVQVNFRDERYFVPEEVMEVFITEITDKWDKANIADIPAKQLLKDVTLTLMSQRPEDPRGIVEHERMIGVTHADSERVSFVYAPYVISHGGAGYELRLQMCAPLFPFREEVEDVAWMTEHDLL
jgi:hypothetical protein